MNDRFSPHLTQKQTSRSWQSTPFLFLCTQRRSIQFFDLPSAQQKARCHDTALCRADPGLFYAGTFQRGIGNRHVELFAGFLEQSLLRFQPCNAISLFPYIMADFHGAEFWPAHGAEMRGLMRLLGQGFVVEARAGGRRRPRWRCARR